MTIATRLSDFATVHLFEISRTAFALWRPHHTHVSRRPVIGEFAAGNPPTLAHRCAARRAQPPTELGVNALELLPPADSFVEREWGYATSNYFAPDRDPGFPAGNSSPTPHGDLIALIAACHARGIRVIADMVMAFGTRAAMERVNYPDFHIHAGADPDDSDAQQSSGQGHPATAAARRAAGRTCAAAGQPHAGRPC